MKKTTLVSMIAIIMLAITTTVNAQAQSNYFIGKWKLVLKDLPTGDAHLNLTIADSAGALKAVMVDSADATKIIKVSKIDRKGDEMTMYFTAQGNDVSVSLTRKDADHASGSLMSMFDAVAVRTKE